MLGTVGRLLDERQEFAGSRSFEGVEAVTRLQDLFQEALSNSSANHCANPPSGDEHTDSESILDVDTDFNRRTNQSPERRGADSLLLFMQERLHWCTLRDSSRRTVHIPRQLQWPGLRKRDSAELQV